MSISPENTFKYTIDRETETIQAIVTKYKDNPYMLDRIRNYVCIHLPTIIDNIKKDKDFRDERKEYLSSKQDIFVHNYMLKMQYYYCSTTDKFFYNDGFHYQICSEDDVLYNILMSINKERELLCWKQNTKQKIINKIKERSFLHAIPESELIQYVLDTLHPVFFENKSEVKYFLCIIGDAIFKKNTHLIHIINARSKKFIQELNNICQVYIGTNLSSTFRHKYYDHDYSVCRILRVKDIISHEHIWGPILSTPSFVIDLICVACHYSDRYGSSDNYLTQSSNDQSFIDFVFSLKNHTFDSLVQVFIRDFLELGGTTGHTTIVKQEPIHTQITWKDMQYLWKQFLDKNNLPNIIFQNKLKTILMTHLSEYYKEPVDAFVGISCKYIPSIKLFIEFWENNVSYIDTTPSELNEYEISELGYLYKKWCNAENKYIRILNEKQILDLIYYFYPNVEVNKEKYIGGISCSLWNKQDEISISLEKFKEELKNTYKEFLSAKYNPYMGSIYTMDTYDKYDNSSNSCDIKISIYDAYIYYCNYSYSIHKTHEQNVSKSYFEKYIYEHLTAYIKEDVDATNTKYIFFEWLHT